MNNDYTITLTAQEVDTLVRMYDILVEEINWEKAKKWGDVDTINATGDIIMKLFYMQQIREMAQK